ncbi:MAG: valine--tRNA ligase [Oscillospiraceae bacterium]|jgi:valyl-tRNA synthetase|nr:valine--tRNA ligase [Oscillospiraceae bacterium]
MELDKVYDPRSAEPEIYKYWEDNNLFRAEADPDKPPFSIVIPPPNVTGQLHLGHALDNTVQDVLTRAKRMQGYAAVWVPGTDHAGIATQIKVEEELRKEGLTRYDLGREKFLERVWAWKDKYGGRIIEQLKLLGSSCDWSRERFTMDDGCSRAVREVFVRLYEKGLIYKGNRIINWCPHCTTALSDTEVEHEETPGHFWHIKYRVKDTDEYVVVATTRPETMLGDTAVAVNPNDPRYAHLVGKTVILPLVNREIPIIADDYVDTDFGTGCVKITPCHDPNDFEVGQRHNLEQILVMDNDARIINGGVYDGLDRYDARKRIAADLDALGLLGKIEEHSHNVGKCYRCGTTVEPITSPQWFVKMAPLAEPAIDAARGGRVKFVPERFTKTYLSWMENVRDWCISRQLWWGHQIPAWTCADCGHITVSRTDPDACGHCGSAKIERDPDVLDTWFSSALWPFEVFGWPDKTSELDYWYPTTVVTPGYDIIFFWVARMIFSGVEQMGDVPFRTAYIHGLVLDANGKKMHKSAGNGIDPQEMIDKYGADALRMNMITGNSPGNDMRFYTERCEAMRNFANKIWNASRFVLMNLKISEISLPDTLDAADRWILTKLNETTREVTDNIERFELGVAATKLYDFIWDDFCDWYIELTKPRLYSEDESAATAAQRVLLYTLAELLKLLHPFMPFITERIWQSLPGASGSIMVRKYPEFDESLYFPDDAASFSQVTDAIRAVRARRAEMNIPPSKRSSLAIVVSDARSESVFAAAREYLKKLAYATDVTLQSAAPDSLGGLVSVATDAVRIFIPLAELVDVDAERARIVKELEKAKSEIEKTEAKLRNAEFTSRAPEQVVQVERDKIARLTALAANLGESLKGL